MKSYNEIYDAMKNYIVANQSKVTDLNEGSVMASLLEAVAREIAAEYISIVANIDTYQKKIAFAQFDFQKKTGLAATGSVVFTRNPAIHNNIDIPSGTELATSDGIAFVTVGDNILPAGSLVSGTVLVECKSIGKAGNVDAGEINVISSVIPGLASVTNDVACSGGVDEETDLEYSNRFRTFILGLGQASVPGIRAAVLGINGLKSCSVVEHFPPQDGCNFSVYAEDGSGTLPQGYVSQIQTVLDGDDTHSGIRAAGLRSRILSPALVMLTVTVSAHINWSVPPHYIDNDIRSKITSYVATLGIGECPSNQVIESLVRAQYGIISVDEIIISGLPGVFDATMIARVRAVTTEFV